jgi:hypothetical protein
LGLERVGRYEERKPLTRVPMPGEAGCCVDVSSSPGEVRGERDARAQGLSRLMAMASSMRCEYRGA